MFSSHFSSEHSASEIAAILRDLLPDWYFVNTPQSRMRRHFDLLARIEDEPIILEFSQTPGAGFSELIVCAFDDAEPGLLSKVAGTLAAQKIAVHTAWIHSIQDENARWIALDTLLLSETSRGRSRPLSASAQKRLNEQLHEVLSSQITVAQLLSSRKSRPHAPLSICELSAQPADETTLFQLRAADDEALLYRITRAFAALGFHIAHAQLNTDEKAANDLFFVRTETGALSSEDAEKMAARVRAVLQNDALLAG